VEWLTPHPFGESAFHEFQSPRYISASPSSKAYSMEDMHGNGGPFSALLLDALVFAVSSLVKFTFKNVKMH
jgi:hypothetical protein